MNKAEKLIQQQFLNDEEAIIRRLKAVYNQSYKDITGKISKLDMSISALQKAYADIGDEIGPLAGAVLKNAGNLTPEEAQETIQSMIQSKVYQKTYQEALKTQVDDVLGKMLDKEYTAVSDYLTECYENGFVGTMMNFQSQGIPMLMPIDQEAMVRAVQLDSPIKEGLYKHLGEDVGYLKKQIAAQVSRGISTGMTYAQVAEQISRKMMGTYENPGGSLAYASRIARTEGHRIQCQSSMDACYNAKDHGADVVKQWDSTLDGRTRESHQIVDGEIRELDKTFSNGLRFPGDPWGGAAEVVNCRCALLQRAKWALDEDELETLKERAAFYGLDKTQNFEDFKAQYLKATQAAPVKKEYLTKKKLEQKIADADGVLSDLEKKINAAGDPVALKALQKQFDDLTAQKDEWAEMLNTKVVAAETKKLKKLQIQYQDDLDNFPVKTYSNIWKDDVTTADWSAKQGSIPAKKQYFQGKLASAVDPDDVKKWQDLLDSVDDFDKQGAAYYKIRQNLDKATNDLKNLQKSGKIGSKALDDAFSQDRKDAALWFDRNHGGFSAADKYFDPLAKQIHGAATRQEQKGFYTYTAGSGGHNRPLAGFQKPWSKPGRGWEEEFYVGPKKVWIDFEEKGDQIRGLTTLIQKSTYNDDVWLQSGQDFQTIEGFLGIPYGSLYRMSDSDLQQYVGRRNVIYNFISTAVNEGGGSMFNEKPLKINFYAPKGSQMLYASDVGAFGKGENEMILQRGGTYEITKIYWGKDATDGNTRKIFVDMEAHPEAGYDLFQQDPSEWKGSKKNHRNS